MYFVVAHSPMDGFSIQEFSDRGQAELSYAYEKELIPKYNSLVWLIDGEKVRQHEIVSAKG